MDECPTHDLAALRSQVDDFLKKANAQWGPTERHPDVFNLRAREFAHLVEQLPQKRFEVVVDAGCGNGFMSALWSLVSEQVIAVDAPKERLIQHSIGLDRARTLLNGFGLENVETRPGQLEQLPLKSGSVDVVFTCYVLEHIMDLAPALKEASRVLKAGGIHVHIVPDFRDKIRSYVEWIVQESKPSHLLRNLARPFYNILTLNWGRLPYAFAHILPFLPPPPHDGRKSFFRECWTYRRSAWENVFYQNKLVVIKKIDMPRRRSTGYILKKEETERRP